MNLILEMFWLRSNTVCVHFDSSTKIPSCISSLAAGQNTVISPLNPWHQTLRYILLITETLSALNHVQAAPGE